MTQFLHLFAAAGGSCTLPGSGVRGFFGFPHWWEYLSGTQTGNGCSPAITGINDIWLVVAAVIEILLRIAALAAVAMIIYGGIQYITSQGGDQASKARGTLINALVGLAIAVLAAVIIQFIAGSIH